MIDLIKSLIRLQTISLTPLGCIALSEMRFGNRTHIF